MSTKVKEINIKENLTLKNIILIGLMIIIAYAPFFRGLYFEKELFPTHIISFILALIWIGSKFKDKNYSLIKSSMDLFGVGVVLMYIVSCIYGVNTRPAIGEALKYVNYFVIYILARDLANTDKKRKYLIDVILLSGIGVSLVGIGSAIGTFSYNGAYVGGRINSTFQYPNALASYLGALFILAIGFLIVEEDKRKKIFYSIASNIYLFTFILTYSRGMWLLLPLVLIIFLALIPNKRKLEVFLYILINSMITLPLSFIFGKSLEASELKSWMIFIGSFIIVSIVAYLISKVEDKLREISFKRIIIALSIIVVMMVGLLTYAIRATVPLKLENTLEKDKWTYVIRNVEKVKQNEEYTLKVEYNGEMKEEKPYIGRIRVYNVDGEGNLEKLKFNYIKDIEKNKADIPFETIDTTEGVRVYFDNYYTDTSVTYKSAKIFNEDNLIKDIKLKYKYIPERIVSRLDSISLKEQSALARVAFYKDAFRIIKDNFIFGTGGGGWNTLYEMYQSYGYNSTQAHNYFLQMWIEIGIIGLLIFIGFILMPIYFLFKRYKDMELNKKVLEVTVLVATISILMHAFMDFDLSLSALAFVLWALVGLLAQTGEDIKFNINLKGKKAYKIIFSIVLVLTLFTTTSFFIANSYAQKAIEANSNKDLNKALDNFSKATKFDPFKPEYKSDLATLYMAKFRSERNNEYLKKSQSLLDETINLAKYNSKFHAIAASNKIRVGKIEEGLKLIDRSVKLKPMKTQSYTQKTDAYLAVYNYYVQKDIKKAKDIIKRAYEVKEDIRNINKTSMRSLDYDEDLLYKLGYIQFFYENLKNREYKITKGYSLDFAYFFDLDINDDGNIDKLHTWNSKNGNIKYEAKEEYLRITNNGDSYGLVYPYGLDLEPDTEYKVIFKARGTVKSNTLRFYVYDSKAKKKAQAVLKDIKLDKDWEHYEVDFKTDSDLKPGTQYLRFQHNGKDGGYVDLEEVLIFKK